MGLLSHLREIPFKYFVKSPVFRKKNVRFPDSPNFVNSGPDVMLGRALHKTPLFSKSFFHNIMKYSNRMPYKWPRIPLSLQNMQLPLAHLCSILRSFDHDEKGRLTKIVLRYRLQSIGLLICTLIYQNQGLEKFQVLQTWIFFQFFTLFFSDL